MCIELNFQILAQHINQQFSQSNVLISLVCQGSCNAGPNGHCSHSNYRKRFELGVVLPGIQFRPCVIVLRAAVVNGLAMLAGLLKDLVELPGGPFSNNANSGFYVGLVLVD